MVLLLQFMEDNKMNTKDVITNMSVFNIISDVIISNTPKIIVKAENIKIHNRLNKFNMRIPEDGTKNYIAFLKDDGWVKTKTGRFLAKKLNLKEFCSDVVIQKISAEINNRLFGTVVKVCKGDKITENYSKSVGGNSCMTGACCDYTRLYENNPDRYAMLTVFSDKDSGRAMLIKLDNGKYLLDRVYATCESLKIMLQEYAIQHGYYYRGSYLMGRAEIYFEGYKIAEDTYENMVVSGLVYEDGEVPYMDTLTKYKLSGNKLDIFSRYSKHDCEGILESQTGTLYEWVCSICDEFIPEDEVCECGGETICRRCYEEYFTTCELCDEVYHNDDINEIDGAFVCNECVEENYAKCDICDEFIPIKDGIDVGNDFVCDECAEENYDRCYECGKFFSGEDGEFVFDKFVCDECLKTNYKKCSECGEWELAHFLTENNKNTCRVCLGKGVKCEV